MQERLAVPLLVAALLTLPAIAIEQSDVGQPWDTIASVLNWVIWTAFLAEAILMLRVVDDRWRRVRGHPQARTTVVAARAPGRHLLAREWRQTLTVGIRTDDGATPDRGKRGRAPTSRGAYSILRRRRPPVAGSEPPDPAFSTTAYGSAPPRAELGPCEALAPRLRCRPTMT